MRHDLTRDAATPPGVAQDHVPRFREILRFELATQLRRPWPWLLLAVLLVFSVLMTRDGSLAEALYDEFFVNSPFSIAKTTVAGTLIWLLIGAMIAGDAAARDVATRMHPLVYTLPVSRGAYLGGRFAAALLLNAVILLALPLGALVAVVAPGVDAELLGPFRPAAYLTAYAYLALPTAIAATALQFWLALRSGRPMAGYGGSLLLFAMSYVVATVFLMQGRQDVARLLDPVGVHFILSDLSHLWTTYEKRWRLLALDGTVLPNRLLWLGVAAGALALAYRGFRFEHRAAGRHRWTRWWRRGGARRAAAPPHAPSPGARAGAPVVVPAAPLAFGAALRVRQTLAIAWNAFRTIAGSWAGRVLLVLVPLFAVLVVLDQMELNGVPLVPTTARVLVELTAPLSAELSRWVIVPLLVVYFAGELLWQERDAGLGEITDAMPGSGWVPLLGKLLGLALVLVTFLALQMGAGIAAQLLLGHRDLELGLYLTTLFGLQLPEYLLFAVLALVVHVVADQKYLGHLAAVLALVFVVMPALFGVEHRLLVYATGPAWTYTEMRGFGASLAPWLWFKLYWAAWAVLLAVAARLLLVRGRDDRPAQRLRRAPRRLTRPTVWTGALAAGGVLATGAFIFHNTNVRNEYLTGAALAERRAEYERRYARYADAAQPRLAATTLRVELYPARREATIEGVHRLVNGTAATIDSVHVATPPGLAYGALSLDRSATLVHADEPRGHRIYALARPLAPGDTMQLRFTVRVAPDGFRNAGVSPALVANGTSLPVGSVLPAIGYQRGRELVGGADRRAHGLPPRPLIASLYDAEANADFGGPGGVALDAVVGTSADQIAVVPGVLRGAWTENGRRYFRYATDAPVAAAYPILSARYAVHESTWTASDGSGQRVAIRLLHHPPHTAVVERMLRSVHASLDFYTARFGAYPYGHLSLVEAPGNGTGLHADPSLITFSEGAALMNPDSGARSLDFPFAVMGHEMAHQWTVPYAFAEGAPVLSEGLAWYYAMRLVRHEKGEAQLQQLLRFMRRPQPIAPIRRGEPLLRGLDPWMSYRKGPYALHALGAYIGHDRVDLALRRLRAAHLPDDAPAATMLDLYRELQAVTPDSVRPLLHDLFEVNAFWELRTERASARRTASGSWTVTLEVHARKVVADSTGAETEVPIPERIPIGVFARAAPGAGELGAPLYLELHRIRPGTQTITVTVPHEPLLAGVDPFHLLDWEEGEDDDNVERVRVTPAGSPPATTPGRTAAR